MTFLPVKSIAESIWNKFLANEEWQGLFKSLLHENQLIGPLKYTLVGSKSSQKASIFHEKNDGGVKK